MIKEGRFGLHEAISLAALTLMTKVFYTSIRSLIKATGTAAWYTTLISCSTSIIMFIFVCTLMKRFEGKELVDILKIVFGNFIGSLLALIYVAYFIFYSGASIREFLEMVKAYVYPYTEPSIIIFIFITVIVLYAYKGLEAIARVAYISFIIVLIGVAILLLLAIPLYNPDYLFPLGGYGIEKTLETGFLRSSAYSDVIFLAFIANALQGVKNFTKTGIYGLVISGLIISIIVLCDLMTFQYTQGAENLSSLFQMSRAINYGRFLQRIEAIFLFIWVIGSFVNVAIIFYTSQSIFCKVFAVPDQKPLLLPMAFLTFMITLLPKNLPETLNTYILFLREYSVFIVYLIPFLALAAAVVFRKKGCDFQNEKE